MAYSHIPLPKMDPIGPFGLNDRIQVVATCLAGAEPWLAEELKELGIPHCVAGLRHQRFDCRFGELLKLLYLSRLTVRFLVPLCEGRLRKPEELYKKAYAIPWESWIPTGKTFAVDANVKSAWFKQDLYPALVVKDALADRIRDKSGKRPNVDKLQPDVRIHLRIDEVGGFTIALDASGFSLQRRGYRRSGGPAPISEILAALLVRISGWRGQMPMLDPFCGGATLLIEAIRVARNLPSAQLAPDFSAFHWPGFDKSYWENIKSEAESQIKPLEVRVIGADKQGSALSLGKVHAEAAGLRDAIEWIKADARFLAPGHCAPGMVLTNPPYGERIAEIELEQLYADWGRQLKNHFEGWQVWVVSAHKDALKRIGFKHNSQHQLMNSTLPVWFREFHLYKGSKKEVEPT